MTVLVVQWVSADEQTAPVYHLGPDGALAERPARTEVVMIDAALVVWYVLTAASIAFMAFDLATNTPAMGVMQAAWILIALYLGPIGLVAYLCPADSRCRGTVH